MVTGSTGSPGRCIPGSLCRWVTKCDPVPSLLDTGVENSSKRFSPPIHRTDLHEICRDGNQLFVDCIFMSRQISETA